MLFTPRLSVTRRRYSLSADSFGLGARVGVSPQIQRRGAIARAEGTKRRTMAPTWIDAMAGEPQSSGSEESRCRSQVANRGERQQRRSALGRAEHAPTGATLLPQTNTAHCPENWSDFVFVGQNSNDGSLISDGAPAKVSLLGSLDRPLVPRAISQIRKFSDD
jgi:hypothetical protein